MPVVYALAVIVSIQTSQKPCLWSVDGHFHTTSNPQHKHPLRYTRRMPHLCKPGRIACMSTDASGVESAVQWPTTKTALRKLSKVLLGCNLVSHVNMSAHTLFHRTTQADLESHLQRRQLPTSGLKGELIDRLYAALKDEAEGGGAVEVCVCVFLWCRWIYLCVRTCVVTITQSSHNHHHIGCYGGCAPAGSCSTASCSPQAAGGRCP